MTTTQIILELPWPPSVNHYWRRVGNRTVISKKGREYKAACQRSVLEQLGALPRLSCRLSVQVDLYPPDRRRRDIDNSAKALLDGLTTAGVWHDDQQIDELSLLRCEVRRGGMAVVQVLKFGEN